MPIPEVQAFTTGAPEFGGTLEDRLRFETLLADLFARFVNVPADRLNREIGNAHRTICEALRIDHSSVWQITPDNPEEFVLIHLVRDPNLPPPLSLDVARAAVQAGHRDHQLVFAHPSNLAGVRIAIESGVDVLAHVPDADAGINDAVLHNLLVHHMAMVPTLKLFSHDSNIPRLRQIVAQYHAMGGRLMFGTDTGFLRDYSVEEEYQQLGLAGLSFEEVLAMLTTTPAEEFDVAAHVGRIQSAMMAT